MTHFTGVLAVLHTPTVDGRQLANPHPHLTRRPTPLPLVRPGTPGIGRIDKVWRDNNLIHYSGELDDNHPDAAEILADIEAGRLVGMLDAVDGDHVAAGSLVLRQWRVAGATLMPSEGRAWPEVSLTLDSPVSSEETSG